MIVSIFFCTNLVWFLAAYFTGDEGEFLRYPVDTADSLVSITVLVVSGLSFRYDTTGNG